MTEAEWLTWEDPRKLLGRWARFPERTLILFGCACCRFQWHLFTPDLCRVVINAEARADGALDASEMGAVRQSLETRYPNLFWPEVFPELRPHWAAWLAAVDEWGAQEFQYQHPLASDDFDDMLAALKDDLSSYVALAAEASGAVYDIERAMHADLLRDIFGNPFRPVAFDPAWRASAVVALATGIYEERAFDRMPILADALQDAGCDNEDILNHCRQPGDHVRGCWVADLVLGKS